MLDVASHLLPELDLLTTGLMNGGEGLKVWLWGAPRLTNTASALPMSSPIAGSTLLLVPFILQGFETPQGNLQKLAHRMMSA